jgi:hypothetical protein
VKKFFALYGFEIHCRPQTSPPLDLNRSQKSPTEMSPSFLSKISKWSSYICLSHPSVFHPFRFAGWNFVHISHSLTNVTHLFDFMALIIFVREYKLWRSSLYTFLPPLVISSESQVFSSAPFLYANREFFIIFKCTNLYYHSTLIMDIKNLQFAQVYSNQNKLPSVSIANLKAGNTLK